jgi:hypothetical protein
MPQAAAIDTIDLDDVALRLMQDGFVVIPRAVPPATVMAAMRVINRSLGKYMPLRTNQCPDCVQAPEVVALIHSPKVVQVIRHLVGETHPARSGQIALRFPGDGCDDTFRPHPNAQLHWHIDGLASPGHNSVPVGEVHNFTCLAGVLLQDVLSENMGNLIVHPGSHFELANYFSAVGFEGIKQGGTQALPNREMRFSRPHQQVLGHAGDLVLVNYMVAHAIAPNTSPLIRYCVYFRLHSRTIKEPGKHRPESMLHPWIDWKGVQPVFEAFHDSSGAAQSSSQKQGSGHTNGTAPVASNSYVTGNFEDDLQIALALSQEER